MDRHSKLWYLMRGNITYIPYPLIRMNKTRTQSLAQPAPTVANRRPKRCHLCHKTYPADKYQAHLDVCCRQQNQKLEEARARNRTKAVHQPAVPSHTVPKREKETEQTGNRFRIKNVSGVGQESRVQVNKKPEVGNTRKYSTRPTSVARESQKRETLREKKQVQIEKKEEVRENPEVQRPIPSQPTQVRPQVVQPRREPTPPEPEPQPVPHPAPEPANNTRHQVRMPLFDAQPSSNAEARNEGPPAFEPQPLDMSTLVSNSNSIIEFISTLNVIQQDETLTAMTIQLQQLNVIAEQISELNSIGGSIASTMGQIFASRIHELQTAIVEQIGIALMRTFNDRLSSAFQGLLQQQPTLCHGFTQAQIQRNFSQKLSGSQRQCSICLSDIRPTGLVLQLQCRHHFHPDCIKQWLNSSKKCPMCRHEQVLQR